MRYGVGDVPARTEEPVSDEENDKIKDVFRNPPPAPLEEPYRPGRARFPGISARAWEHPADRAALTALRKVPGFDLMLRRMFGLVSERALRFQYLANAVRVDERQFRKVHAVWRECCQILDAEKVPELFVTQTPMVNAGAIGIDDPFVVLNSGTIDLLDEDELRFVLGHELAHVLSGHALYRTMLFVLLRLVMPLVMTLPVAGLMLRGVLMALFEWSRKSELSCDRAGLLCMQDPQKAYRIHMKMAGGNKLDQMDLDAFLAQAAEYETGGDVRDNVIKFMSLMWSTHPFPVLRLGELKRWVDGGHYQRIVDGEYARRVDDPEVRVRDDIGESASSYKERWSEREDALGRLVQDVSGLLGSGAGAVWDQVREMFRGRDGAEADEGEPEAEAGEAPEAGDDPGPDREPDDR